MTLDRMVVVRGAAGGLILSVPAAMANVVLADQDPKSQILVNLSFVLVLVGFALAGFVAGLDAPDRLVAHGIAAAAVAFVIIEVISILGRLDRGDDLSVPAIVIVAGFAVLGGRSGARAAAARRAKKENP
jgi:putative membrane protein (TIGR04086 family)